MIGRVRRGRKDGCGNDGWKDGCVKRGGGLDGVLGFVPPLVPLPPLSPFFCVDPVVRLWAEAGLTSASQAPTVNVTTRLPGRQSPSALMMHPCPEDRKSFNPAASTPPFNRGRRPDLS